MKMYKKTIMKFSSLSHVAVKKWTYFVISRFPKKGINPGSSPIKAHSKLHHE